MELNRTNGTASSASAWLITPPFADPIATESVFLEQYMDELQRSDEILVAVSKDCPEECGNLAKCGEYHGGAGNCPNLTECGIFDNKPKVQ